MSKFGKAVKIADNTEVKAEEGVVIVGTNGENNADEFVEAIENNNLADDEVIEIVDREVVIPIVVEDIDEADMAGRYFTQPPTFSGEKIDQFPDWLARFEVVAEANNWNAEKRLKIIPSCLTHYAFQVYRLDITDAQKQDYTQLREVMLEKFDSGDKVFVHRLKLRAIHREIREGLDAFLFRVRKLVTLAFPKTNADERAIHEKQYFIMGFPRMRSSIFYD